MLKNYIIGKIDPKLKGKAYLDAVTKALSPENIAKCDPEEETKTPAMERAEHRRGEEVKGK
jgi:hypothetical protein